MARTLIINGSLGGSAGNTAPLLAALASRLRSESGTGSGTNSVEVVHLASSPAPSRGTLASFDAFVFATGTYWDSWGSPLQKFLEDVTPLEGDDCWFGKPAAILVTMHSVGGKGVLSRLQGVLNTFGLYIPPMSAMTYSLANQEALGTAGDHEADLWCVDDLDVLAGNLLAASSQPKLNWNRWPVDRSNPRRIWLNLRR